MLWSDILFPQQLQKLFTGINTPLSGEPYEKINESLKNSYLKKLFVPLKKIVFCQPQSRGCLIRRQRPWD